MGTPVREWLVMAGLVALLATAPARAQQADYLALIASYANGDTARAVKDFSSWPESKVRSAFRATHLPLDRIKAAAMLHSEVALVVADPQLAFFHINRADSLLSGPSKGDRDSLNLHAFVPRWAALRAVAFINMERYQGARMRVDVLKRPKYPDSTLMIAASDEADARDTFEPNLRGRWVTTDDSEAFRAVEARIQDGLAVLRELVLEHSSWPEGHLRLANLLLESGGRADDIREQLNAVLAGSDRADLRYLAHLFLGGLSEREKQVSNALSEYRQAHEALPRQTSFIALMRLERDAGNDAAVQKLWSDFIGAEPMAGAEDPWPQYINGFTGGELLEWLRAAAHT